MFNFCILFKFKSVFLKTCEFSSFYNFNVILNFIIYNCGFDDLLFLFIVFFRAVHFYSHFRGGGQGNSPPIAAQERTPFRRESVGWGSVFFTPREPLPGDSFFYAVSIEICAKLTKNDRNEKQNRRKFEFSKNAIAIRRIL